MNADIETLTGKFLIAMPGLEDPRFDASVVYICAHSDEGAMGLIINKASETIAVDDVFEQLELTRDASMKPMPVQYGGPVEMARGFILHSADYVDGETSLPVTQDVTMTASRDVLSAISEGAGPERRMLCLGYAGWEPDQLEQELRQNAWLACDAKMDILFDTAQQDIWDAALRSMGVEPAVLSGTAGRA